MCSGSACKSIWLKTTLFLYAYASKHRKEWPKIWRTQCTTIRSTIGQGAAPLEFRNILSHTHTPHHRLSVYMVLHLPFLLLLRVCFSLCRKWRDEIDKITPQFLMVVGIFEVNVKSYMCFVARHAVDNVPLLSRFHCMSAICDDARIRPNGRRFARQQIAAQHFFFISIELEPESFFCSPSFGCFFGKQFCCFVASGCWRVSRSDLSFDKRAMRFGWQRCTKHIIWDIWWLKAACRANTQSMDHQRCEPRTKTG